jgi:pyruvate formate lyase activating enzyme
MGSAPKLAEFWEPLDDSKVLCDLCPNACVIAPGSTGVCRIRENRDGRLYTLNYGLVSSLALDPVEKKPLYHVDPGSLLLSAGSYGCNLGCEFCQNSQISQARPRLTEVSPELLVRTAVSQRETYSNVVGIAYTYNEPTVWMEYILEAAEKAKEAGLRNVLVTNGYVSKGPLEKVLEFIDAVNIDVKAWTEEFYRHIAHGRLKPVVEAVEEALKHTWVEVTYLVIEGQNDNEGEVRGLARHLASLSPSIPLHLSRYFPNYRMGGNPTSLATLDRLRDAAREHLHYVYIGNVVRKGYSDTLCPECGTALLERSSLELERSHLSGDGTCLCCGRPLEMVGKVHR